MEPRNQVKQLNFLFVSFNRKTRFHKFQSSTFEDLMVIVEV